MNERYTVRVTKDFLVFSAAHFITYASDRCERLHGHNYRAQADVAGPLDGNHYVVDFIALRDWMRQIVDRLDHRVLLPLESALIAVSVAGEQVTARFQERTWSFPREDCVLLPIANSTTELLARWIGLELLEQFRAAGQARPARLRIALEENFGQWGTWEWEDESTGS